MSLFVWNDRRWQLVEENDDYDKKNYLVIRKLFVRWLKCSDTTGVNGLILKEFKRFGPIESVETVSGVRANLYVHEAYVTFERSIDAYKAFIENRNNIKSTEELLTVLPIDTWNLVPVQSKNEALAELSCRVVKIVEDPDDEIIYRMRITPGTLLRVLRSFIRLGTDLLDGLDLQYELDGPASRSHNDSSDDESEELEETEKTDGTKATVASFKRDLRKAPSDPDSKFDCLTNEEFEKRIAEVIVHNISPRFGSLTIRKKCITQHMLQTFDPVLRQINRLTLHLISDCNVFYALPAHSPNIENIHMDGIEWHGEFDALPPEHWPSLKELYIEIFKWTDKDWKKFRQFIKLNNQILSLQVESPIDLETLTTIGKTLYNLSTLAFVRINFEGLNAVLDNLAGLTEMLGLKMSALDVEKNHLNGLVKITKRLSRLHHLQLITIFLNCEGNSEKDKDFTRLKEFRITHHFNCKCHGPNRVISFHDNDIEVPDEKTVLVLIVNTKSPNKTVDKSMETEILAIFKKTTKFFPNVINQVELEDSNNYIYVQVSSRN